MTDLLQSAAIWLAGKRKAHAGQPVTYQRGDLSVALTATVGRTEWESASADGTVVRFKTRDWIVTAADLAVDGVLLVPAHGDRIVMADGVRYEVSAPAGQAVWQWSDEFDVSRRIHTKCV